MRHRFFQIQNLLLLALIFTGCTGPARWLHNVNTKARELLDMHHDHQVLEHKFAELQKKYIELENSYQSVQAELDILKKTENNFEETGSKHGRTLASIQYDIPVSLSLESRYNLAFEQMRHKHYEEAAKTFESFLSIPEAHKFQNANAFYSAGVAWFELKNYKRAQELFETAVAHANPREREIYLKRVDLWMRVLNRY